MLGGDWARYLSAVRRGPAVALTLTVAAARKVLASPPAKPSVGRKRRADATIMREVYNGAVPDEQAFIRFTIYKELKDSFGYGGGPRTPFPPTVEALIKAVFPGARPVA